MNHLQQNECRRKREVEAWLRGEDRAGLRAPQTSQQIINLRAHIRGCAACKEHYDQLVVVERHLEAASDGHRRVSISSAEVDAIEAAIIRSTSSSQRVPSHRRVPRPIWFAASIALAAASYALVIRTPELKTPSDAWRARGARGESSSALYAFCFDAGGSLVAELEAETKNGNETETENSAALREPPAKCPPAGDIQLAARIDNNTPYLLILALRVNGDEFMMHNALASRRMSPSEKPVPVGAPIPTVRWKDASLRGIVAIFSTRALSGADLGLDDPREGDDISNRLDLIATRARTRDPSARIISWMRSAWTSRDSAK